MRRVRFLVVAAAVAAGLVACKEQDRTREVEQAVQQYLAKLVEAYRVSDASLLDPLVGEEQGLKLIGLIGVKRDAGVVLDARVLDLQVVRVERRGDRWIAETRERWHYRDRRIGSGEQVGDESTDSYALRYEFSRKDGRFVLEALEFTEPPVVGRTSAPVPVDARVLHGLPGEAARPPESGTGETKRGDAGARTPGAAAREHGARP